MSESTDQSVFPEWRSFLGNGNDEESASFIKSVVKRSGEIAAYDRNKIEKAIGKAIEAVEKHPDPIRAEKLTDAVEEHLKILLAGRRAHSIPAIEEIQDVVETVLIENKEVEIAKAYILYRSRHEALRDSKKLMLDSASLYEALTNEVICQKLGYDTATIAAMFIPNTYEVYWNISVNNFLDKMNTECMRFWTFERAQKAKQMKLSTIEVSTLASIIDEETANDAEKPMIAGMYYNRLMLRNEEYPNGMPLQADPTIKFAWKKFELKRIYNNLLHIDSPYNTYTNTGLPPGPIRIPSIAGLDAVLNHVHHKYLYMCAKEDFSGTHNFAETYEEHMENAAKYSKALNERGIK